MGYYASDFIHISKGRFMFLDMRTGRPLKPRATAFGRRLAELRQKAGISQAQLGEKLELSQRAIANWEMRETTSLRPDQIARLAEVLKVSVEFLITGAEPGAREKPGPKGQLAEAFLAVSKLPRRQQQKVVEMAQGFVALHDNEKSS